MFKLGIVPFEIVKHSEYLIDHFNFGKRFAANGSPEEQRTGVIGQNMVLRLLGYPLMDGSGGCDDGTDIDYGGMKVDIKTMGRDHDPKPDWVNNYIGYQMKFKTDVFIFCSFNKSSLRLTVCGYCPKDLFIKKASYYPQGTPRYRDDGSTFPSKAPLYEIKNSDIVDVQSIQDLIEGLDLTKKILAARLITENPESWPGCRQFNNQGANKGAQDYHGTNPHDQT